MINWRGEGPLKIPKKKLVFELACSLRYIAVYWSSKRLACSLRSLLIYMVSLQMVDDQGDGGRDHLKDFRPVFELACYLRSLLTYMVSLQRLVY